MTVCVILDDAIGPGLSGIRWLQKTSGGFRHGLKGTFGVNEILDASNVSVRNFFESNSHSGRKIQFGFALLGVYPGHASFAAGGLFRTGHKKFEGDGRVDGKRLWRFEKDPAGTKVDGVVMKGFLVFDAISDKQPGFYPGRNNFV